MARSFDKDLLFDHPVAEVLALFTTPRFLEAEAVMQGQTRAACVEVERSATRLVLRVDQAGPNRIPGARPKEIESALHYTWDLAARACRWHRDSTREKGVVVSGSHALFETPGGGTRYHMSWALEIHIPLLGRALERQAESGILEGAERRAAFARRWLAEGKLIS